MRKPFQTELEASAELDDAAVWYEDQRAGLGSEFLQAVDAALRLVEQWPHAGAPAPDVPLDLQVRRVPVTRFPYHVVYLETQTEIRILAFAHDSRRPGYWRSRVLK